MSCNQSCLLYSRLVLRHSIQDCNPFKQTPDNGSYLRRVSYPGVEDSEDCKLAPQRNFSHTLSETDCLLLYLSKIILRCLLLKSLLMHTHDSKWKIPKVLLSHHTFHYNTSNNLHLVAPLNRLWWGSPAPPYRSSARPYFPLIMWLSDVQSCSRYRSYYGSFMP